ncbi:hypothetical protein B0H13DRAFT_2372123 [Mycena leptocephala]|nr:hypothetical protein B0H13DRAFT_2372123 [Mycena leptocephala]
MSASIPTSVSAPIVSTPSSAIPSTAPIQRSDTTTSLAPTKTLSQGDAATQPGSISAPIPGTHAAPIPLSLSHSAAHTLLAELDLHNSVRVCTCWAGQMFAAATTEPAPNGNCTDSQPLQKERFIFGISVRYSRLKNSTNGID